MMREALAHPMRFVGDHRFTHAQASNYLDEDLDTAARRRVEHHAHVCPPCMRFVESLRRTVSALNGLGDSDRATSATDMSAGDAVIARLRDERRAPTDSGYDTG